MDKYKSKNKIIWIRVDTLKSAEERKKLATTALENNFTNLVIRNKDEQAFKKLGKFNQIHLQDGKIIYNDKSGEHIVLNSPAAQEAALKLAGKTEYVLISPASSVDWKIIPLENLVAAYHKTKTKLLVEITSPKDAKLYLETLEIGVDGVVLNPKNPRAIHELRKTVDTLTSPILELIPVKISKLEAIGMGDRVCIDTCSMLDIGEGMLIGSQSNGLFLVHSESIESEYAAARPFRVNAGPVHSYILLPDDRTKYLSDLQAGDEVLAVSRNGKARPVLIGRVKIEKRPLLLVVAQRENKKYNIILQNAETIRLIAGNEPVSIVDLKEGDSVLMHLTTSGRHFGTKVEESIVEK